MAPMTGRQILEELDTPDIAGFALVGGLLGGTLGFIFRPATAMVGQLPLGTVLRRGADLETIGRLLLPTAQTSFNMLVGGAILGAILGGVLTYQLIRRFSRTAASLRV